MSQVHFISFDGVRRSIETAVGENLMRAATDNGVPGIDGDCGGECACATCHVYVDPAWLALTGSRTEMEQSMLSFAAGTEDNSRLSCQIAMSAELDGLIVKLPEGQH